MADLDAFDGDLSVCAGLFAEVDDGILSFSNLLLLGIPVFDCRRRHFLALWLSLRRHVNKFQAKASVW